GGPTSCHVTQTLTAQQSPAISLAKAAACTQGTAAVDSSAMKTYRAVGQLIPFASRRSSARNTTLGPAQFSVTDDKQGTFNCGPAAKELAPWATGVCTFTHTISQGDIDAGSNVTMPTTSGAAQSPAHVTQAMPSPH